MPKICEQCERDMNQYSPACLHCGRRYLAAIQSLRIEKDDKLARLRKALKDWMAFDHSESALREPVSKKR